MTLCVTGSLLLLLPQLMADVGFLAAPELGGRAAGEPGAAIAARYVAAQLEGCGLLPQLQVVPTELVTMERTSRVELVRGGQTVALALGRDFMPVPRTTTAPFQGEMDVVLCGFGLPDDWSRLPPDAVRGKAALIVMGRPRALVAPPPPLFPGFPRLLAPEERARQAALRGARAVLLMPDPRPEGMAQSVADARPLMHLASFLVETLTIPEARPPETLGHGVPALQVRIDAGLLGDRPHAIATVGRFEHEPGAVLGALPGLRLRLDLALRATAMPVTNVLAAIPGADPALAAEAVVLSCHLDGTGAGLRPGDVHAGANDGASGVAAVLEVARRMARAAERPRRTVVFAFFNARERGLLGSTWCAAHPPVPLAGIRAVLKVAGVGRRPPGPVSVAWAAGAPASRPASVPASRPPAAPAGALPEWLRGAFAGEQLEVAADATQVEGDDHAAFARHGVPAGVVFTGPWPEHHTAADTAERVDFAFLEQVTRALLRAIRALGAD